MCVQHNTYNSTYNSIVFWDINIIEMDSYSFDMACPIYLYVKWNGFMPNSMLGVRSLSLVLYFTSEMCVFGLDWFDFASKNSREFCMGSSAIF